ncbi:ABC transporter substrate-binding protein, partial [Oceanibium sediminis]|uniref:ABC transporter substrate-binding protein n=1 Tax=Oceanibium sediminis TaxID=2026339 RepID=UPI001E550C33
MFMKPMRTLTLAGSLVLSTTVIGAGLLSTAQIAHAFDLAVASGADPTTLDPRKTWVAQGYSINAHVFEPLVFRAEKDGNVVLVPVLAESWKQISPTELEIKIREGVKFQNGEPLNAAAVAYTITSLQDPAFVSNVKLYVRDITEVEVKSEYVLVLKTASPTRGLLNVLAQVPIVAPEAAQSADFEKNPIGTGPYKITSYVPSGQVVIEKNPDYWGT